jgi:hypothetical protein
VIPQLTAAEYTCIKNWKINIRYRFYNQCWEQLSVNSYTLQIVGNPAQMTNTKIFKNEHLKFGNSFLLVWLLGTATMMSEGSGKREANLSMCLP